MLCSFWAGAYFSELHQIFSCFLTKGKKAFTYPFLYPLGLEYGFTLVLDDFGIGYSSLSYLQQFPMDTIKIDRSLISSLEGREESAEIVKSIIAFSKSLDMSVVAEGVENQEQLKALGLLTCDSAQGYLFALPMDKDAATRYLL